MSDVYEEIIVLPFQSSSLELVEQLQRFRHDVLELCAFEWSTDELRGFGEHDLTPRQIDRLLSR